MRQILGRRRLEHSLALATSFLVVTAVGAALSVVQIRMSSSLRDALEDQAVSVASSIGAVSTQALLTYNYAALQQAADLAATEPDLRYVILYDKERNVAGVAGTDFSDGVDRDVRPAGSGNRRLNQRTANGDAPVLEVTVPVRVEQGSQPWGFVRVGMGYDPVLAELAAVRNVILLVGLVLTLLAVAASRWTAGRITAPLRRLSEATEALAWGDTSLRIPISGSTELAELAQSFNRTLERVEEKTAESRAYQDELAKLNATLEEQVLERTQALGESERQYRTLVDNSPDAIVIVQSGRVRFVNRAFTDLFGVPQDRALAPSFRLDELFDDASAQVVRDRLEAWEEGRAPKPAAVSAAGAERRLELELRGSQIEYLGRTAAECLFIDMTEAIRLRQRLEDAERLRSLGELAGGVAHDFNNLLGAILGRTQLLRSRNLPDDVDRDLAVMETAARDGRETVRRIQEFSRVQADQLLAEVDLREVIEDAVEMTRTRWKTEPQRRNAHIELVRELEPVSPLSGNATELREVFTNLIINAVDAMPDGGRLTLRVATVEDGVVAEVEDTGEGMTEEVRRHLFDPFFTTKGMAGTGLGLSVAYGIVLRHGGTIDVHSGLGKGTRFRILLPAEMFAAAEDPRDVARADDPGSARILVIDDELSIAQLLNDALSIQGHQVETVGSGGEGVQRVCDEAFDLVLTDLGMPDMSGWEVAQRIRAARPGLPVMLVTGWGATISEREIVDGGVAAVVHKPFEIDELLQATARVLLEARRR